MLDTAKTDYREEMRLAKTKDRLALLVRAQAVVEVTRVPYNDAGKMSLLEQYELTAADIENAEDFFMARRILRESGLAG
jgi:hypothetical protein